ncbi:MAG TPA: glutathione S-transferase family protein [Eoetvoesiella sp.]
MMTLYDSRYSGNGWKVRQLLSHLQIPFERKELNLALGEARTPELLALNPLARVPVLHLEDGRALRESNAILLYLAHGTPYLPAGADACTEILQWLFFEQYDHLKNFARPRFLVSIAKSASVDSLEVISLLEQGRKALAIMDAHLHGRNYLACDQYTVADIALFPYTAMAPMGGYDLQPYPNVRSWLARVRDQPGSLALPLAPA